MKLTIKRKRNKITQLDNLASQVSDRRRRNRLFCINNMGKWIHKLKNIDKSSNRADCDFCGENIEVVKNGLVYKCVFSRRMQGGGKMHKQWIYRKHFIKSLKTCNKCEIENEDLRFFDVNHIDGDHDNNIRKNLELLCPNCHRVETLNQWNNQSMKKFNRNNYKNIL